jgi:hypothetical protein
MAVGAAGNMGIERHHVIEERRGILADYRAGEHIHFIDEPVAFTEECHELVGMAVLRHPEKKRDNILFYPVDFHDMLLPLHVKCCTNRVGFNCKKTLLM